MLWKIGSTNCRKKPIEKIKNLGLDSLFFNGHGMKSCNVDLNSPHISKINIKFV